MTTVMCFGTFDILHDGHLSYFGQAKKYGDELIVVIARDSSSKSEGKEPVHTEEERLKKVALVPLVDKVIMGNEGDRLQIVISEKPDVIVLGYDQKVDEEKIKERLAEHGLHPQIIRAKAYQPEKYKSTFLREMLR